MKNRVLIYFFYDDEGIVDDYVIYFLKELTKVTGKSVVVVNGMLTIESRKKLENVVDEVICRENHGYDSWAYKEAIEHIGWDTLTKFDELLMVNHTMFGPFYSFEKVFEKMESSDADFWGLQRSYEKPDMKYIGSKKTVHGYMPEFPLSSFWVIRERMLHSYEFKHYWDTLHEVNDYTDACLYHEPVFAKNMCDFGFTMDTFLSDRERNFSINPTIDNIYEQIVIEELPIIRRRAFFNAVDPCFDEGFGDDLSKTLKFIEENYDYDVNLIHQNLLRTCTMYDLQNRLMGIHILEDKYTMASSELLEEVYMAIVIRDSSWIKEIKKYITLLNGECNVTLYARKELSDELGTYIEDEHLECDLVLVDDLVENIETYALKESYQKNFKYIYFVCESEKIGKREIENKNCIERYIGSILQNKNTFYHAISLLENQQTLGALTNMPCYHNVCYNKIGTIGEVEFQQICDWMSENHIFVPIEKKKMPICSYNSSFLCKREAIVGIEDITYDTIENFSDATLGICVSLLAQKNSFYVAYALNNEQAKIDLMAKQIMFERINNNFYEVNKRTLHFRKLLKTILETKTIVKKENEIIPQIKYVEKYVEVNPEEYLEKLPTKMLMRKIIKRMLPQKIWNIFRKKRYKKNLAKGSK